ncbi:hypothetical protein K469DRAFT_694551 [Zopfia rhizophila CBS 207.26]|uniref:Uncharacterized protein n=1 Tax=Zopfia rhizophila CBS 207.26 TaxID=1314779 RepID=A0A6A6EJY6_9PEZI|nr:hypothetical protein K469DRAFT_694551 [Zopfia rhizophila CBS 207.26]
MDLIYRSAIATIWAIAARVSNAGLPGTYEGRGGSHNNHISIEVPSGQLRVSIGNPYLSTALQTYAKGLPQRFTFFTENELVFPLFQKPIGEKEIGPEDAGDACLFHVSTSHWYEFESKISELQRLHDEILAAFTGVFKEVVGDPCLNVPCIGIARNPSEITGNGSTALGSFPAARYPTADISRDQAPKLVSDRLGRTCQLQLSSRAQCLLQLHPAYLFDLSLRLFQFYHRQVRHTHWK